MKKSLARLAGLHKYRISVLMCVFALCLSSLFISGCDNGADPNAQQEEDAGDEGDADVVPDNAGNAGGNDAANQGDNGENPDIVRTDAPAEPEQTAVAEKSPIAITRIEPENIHIPDEPYVTGEGVEPDDDKDKDTDGDGIPDEHDHEPVPNLFPVDKCQVEVNGSYKKDLANELITQINKCRTDYGIPQVSRNTSLLACADNRAKEQTYFIGHFRPNGAPFSSIAPEGQVLGECIAVDYRDAEKMVDAWYSVNDTRMQLMNPDYTQVGVSIYEVDDTYFIAAEFAY